MFRLVYVSTALVDLNETELEALLGPGRVKNEQAGITGLLVQIRDDRDGQDGRAGYLQHLEGTHEAVERTYRRIARDELHTQVTVVAQGEGEGRMFAGWPMRLVMLDREQAEHLTEGGLEDLAEPAAAQRLIAALAQRGHDAEN